MKPITVDPITLAKEIINGRRLTREDDLSYFITCDLNKLCKGADMVREYGVGDKVETFGCAIAKVLPDNRVLLTFDEPQRAITPGQAAVLYAGDNVLGGGEICGEEI